MLEDFDSLRGAGVLLIYSWPSSLGLDRIESARLGLRSLQRGTFPGDYLALICEAVKQSHLALRGRLAADAPQAPLTAQSSATLNGATGLRDQSAFHEVAPGVT